MRPILLKIRGLNSFDEEQQIDFDKLTSAGLFGIFGPTGSGKSTILDAITMALYSEMSRYDGDKRGKQCINANSDNMYVYFEFSLLVDSQSAHYIVERTYKTKDDAIRMVTARLYRKSGGDIQILADKTRTVTEEIVGLIGLSYDDFSRSVILPQGKFSQFLLLANKERRDMLERIFRLEPYGEDLNKRIRSKASEIKTKLEIIENNLNNLGDISPERLSAEQELLHHETSALTALKEETEKKRAFHTLVQNTVQNMRDNESKLAVSTKQLNDQTQEKLRLDQNLQSVKKTYDDARVQKDEKYPQLLTQEANLVRAVKLSAEMQELANERKKMLLEYGSIRDEIKKIETLLTNNDKEQNTANSSLETLTTRKAEINISGDFRQYISQGVAALSKISEIDKKIKTYKAKIEALKSEIMTSQDQIKEVDEAIKKQNHELADSTRKKQADYESLLEELQEKEAELQKAETELETAKVNNSAAIIANVLSHGAPCPVCGSTSHPAPAQAGQAESLAFLTEKRKTVQQDMDKLKKKKDELFISIQTSKNAIDSQLHLLEVRKAEQLAKASMDQKQLSESEDELKNLTEESENHRLELDSIKLRSGTDAFPEWEERIRKYDKERATLEKNETANRNKLESLKQEANNYKSKLSLLNNDLTGMTVRGMEKKEALEKKESEIKEIVGDADPKECLEQIRVEIASLLQLVETNRLDYETLSAAYQKAAEATSGLAKQIELLTDTIDELRARLELTLTEHHYPKDTDVYSLTVSVGSEIAELEKTIEQKAKNTAVIKERIDRMSSDMDKVKALKVQKKEYESKNDLLTDLSGLFMGNRFVEYVARRYLQYITTEASTRLKEMSSGGYALELDGTDFIIRDDHAGGVRRSPRTLSGGETFMVSLCLSLALSSRIQLRNNAPLEFFFLDEGFGSLDSALLDVVMDSLEKLRLQDISIGIISHVEELKSRIPMKLIVTPPRHGLHGTKVHI